jgi:adenosylcobyric acid synthase
VAVILLPHMSNFTDFDNLERIPEVYLYYSNSPNEIRKADILIIPGSKNTISDLQYIKEKGIEQSILDHHKNRKQVYGVCGGFQMMGQKISDPNHVEGTISEIAGLGILPISTTLSTKKKTKQVEFKFLNHEVVCSGYEIHMGETISDKARPLCLADDSADGYFLNDSTWGTYMHGIFDNPIVVESILKPLKQDIKVDFNYKEFKNQEFEKLANLVRSSVDLDYIYKTLQL